MKKIEARDTAGDIYYRMLNRQIRSAIAGGETEIQVVDVRGQRYIGAGTTGRDVVIHIHGIPGQDLGAFLNGATLIVHGNGQDGVANTINAGNVIIHGSAGEIPCYSARGGRVFVRDDVSYRAAIHMKQYGDTVPWLVIGGTAKNYLGEYMAGGICVVLDLHNGGAASPVGTSLATGIHGGTIYIRGGVEEWQLGVGAKIEELESSDHELLRRIVSEFCGHFGGDAEQIIGEKHFIKVVPVSKRPFAKLYTPAHSVGGGRSVHRNLSPPCAFNCPTGIPTPVFLTMVRSGDVDDALRMLDDYTPFRLSCCGTVCDQLCVQECSRLRVDGRSVDVRALAQSYYPDFKPERIGKRKKERIAVIGAGPAGLSVAFQLARRRYEVTLFEASDRIGGKMRVIPTDRLPKKTLDHDLERILSLGITIHTNTRVGTNRFRELYESFDAVVVSTGAHKSRELEFPGSEHAVHGLGFLKAVSAGRPLKVRKKRVVIVGAGNVGMDIACECWRLNARTVTAVDIQEPASFGAERLRAEKAGTKVLWPATVASFSAEGKEVRFKEGKSLEADLLIMAIGEVPDYRDFLPTSVLQSPDGPIRIPGDSFQSTDPKVYVIGDAITMGLITHSVGMGRLAAMEIHAKFQGEEFVFPRRELVPKTRIRTLYFLEEKAEGEVGRCLSCGTCLYCDTCLQACPQQAISREGQEFRVADHCTGCGTCESVCPRGAVCIEL